MKRILIAADGSPSSQEAVEFGLELAEEHRAHVFFVHVLPALDLVPMSGFAMIGARPHELCDDDRRPLDDAEALAESRGVFATTRLLSGNTVDEIVACADNLDVDLIVLGSRGHGTLAGALLGSVSRGVLSESKRPVTVIRGLATVEARSARTEGAVQKLG